MNQESRQQLERLERELNEIAGELAMGRLAHLCERRRWRPAVNAYHCDGQCIICVDLAGIDARSLDVSVQDRKLVIRGSRPPPEPDGESIRTLQVLAMEIDYGAFERVFELPAEVDAGRITAERREGLLWIHLPLGTHA